MRRIALACFLLAAVGFYLALTGGLDVAAEVRPQWQQEWNKVLEEAKKEGRLVLAGDPDYDPIFAEFQKKYPEIKMVAASGRGAQVSQIMTERRVGKYLVGSLQDARKSLRRGQGAGVGIQIPVETDEVAPD